MLIRHVSFSGTLHVSSGSSPGVWYTVVRNQRACICMGYPDVIPIRGRCSPPQLSSSRQAIQLCSDYEGYLVAWHRVGLDVTIDDLLFAVVSWPHFAGHPVAALTMYLELRVSMTASALFLAATLLSSFNRSVHRVVELHASLSLQAANRTGNNSDKFGMRTTQCVINIRPRCGAWPLSALHQANVSTMSPSASNCFALAADPAQPRSVGRSWVPCQSVSPYTADYRLDMSLRSRITPYSRLDSDNFVSRPSVDLTHDAGAVYELEDQEPKHSCTLILDFSETHLTNENSYFEHVNQDRTTGACLHRL